MTGCGTCGNCTGCHDKVLVKKQQKGRTGNIIKLREGFELNVPRNFFDTHTLKGTVFKLRALRQNGEKIALKWVRPSHDCNFSKHVAYLTSAADMTASLLASFKKRVDMKGWNIRVVKPVVPCGRAETSIEPYVNNLEKFNTNTFWECDQSRTYKKLLVALGHFSCVASKGKYVLTNLHGGLDENKRVVTLLPPTVVSAQPGKFGCKDLGTVEKFFKFHMCNSFCKDMPKRGVGKHRVVQFVVE